MGVSKRMLPDVLLYRYVHTDTNVIDTQKLKSALLDLVHSSIKRKRIALGGHSKGNMNAK